MDECLDLPLIHRPHSGTGRDARRRKQYRYHERWREIRDENKFDRLADFAKALPKIRRRITRDMRCPVFRGKRCWRLSYDYSNELSSASATRSTAREQVVWVNHDKKSACQSEGSASTFSVPWKKWPPTRGGRDGSPNRENRFEVPGCAGTGSVSICGARWPSPGRDIPECK